MPFGMRSVPRFVMELGKKLPPNLAEVGASTNVPPGATSMSACQGLNDPRISMRPPSRTLTRSQRSLSIPSPPAHEPDLSNTSAPPRSTLTRFEREV